MEREPTQGLDIRVTPLVASTSYKYSLILDKIADLHLAGRQRFKSASLVTARFFISLLYHNYTEQAFRWERDIRDWCILCKHIEDVITIIKYFIEGEQQVDTLFLNFLKMDFLFLHTSLSFQIWTFIYMVYDNFPWLV